MTRRFPTALGIIVVFTAVYSLHQLAPMIGMVIRDGFELDWMVALMASVSLAQLLAGLAIATGSAYARIAVLAWTLVAIASATFARELIALDFSASGLAIMYVEALAGPVLTWLALAFAGEATPSPAIPRARVVSGADASDAASSSTDALDASRAIEARRPRIGVLLIGFAIAGLVGTLLWHLPMLAMILRSDNPAGALVGEVLFLGHAIAVGLLGLRAGRRLLDPHVDARRARNAVLLYLLVDVGGDVVRVGAQIVFQSEMDLSSDVMTMVLTQWIASAVLDLVLPAFIWFYVKPALRDAVTPPAAEPHATTIAERVHDLAALPAWAMLWFAPFLLSRILLVNAADGALLTPPIMMVIVIICGTLGMLHVLAGVRALRSTTEAHADPATGAARVAASVSLVVAILFVLGWFLVMFAMDPFDGFRSQLPTLPLAQLVACSATMVWALGKRRS